MLMSTGLISFDRLISYDPDQVLNKKHYLDNWELIVGGKLSQAVIERRV